MVRKVKITSDGPIPAGVGDPTLESRTSGRTWYVVWKEIDGKKQYRRRGGWLDKAKQADLYYSDRSARQEAEVVGGQIEIFDPYAKEGG